MKTIEKILATLLSGCSIACLLGGLSGATHQFFMFAISGMVAYVMWDEIYKEWKKEKANEL